MSRFATVYLRVHEQPCGAHVASTTLPDGRVIRVCGYARGSKTEAQEGRSRDVALSLLRNWVTWVRRGSFS